MGDKPDNVPSLEELGDNDDLPGYWTEKTTITVDRYVKESLDMHRDGRPWNQYLEKLRREHADPITFNDVERMAEVLAEELHGDNIPDLEWVAGEIEVEPIASEPDYGRIREIVREETRRAIEEAQTH